jgi:hypothetical protein
LTGSSAGRHPLAIVASLGGAAGAAAAVTRAAISFEHGIWLVAYLLLVGCLAPALISAGERRLLVAPQRTDQGAATAAALWLAGVAAVPVGVLGQARLFVCAGAICLIGSLTLLSHRAFVSGPTAPTERSRLQLAAHALTLVVMAVSTGIGVALAWGYPWL